MSILASESAIARAASYGVQMTGDQHDYTTPEGRAYLDAVHEHEPLNWADKRLKRVTVLRLISDPGFPMWDVSYCHGEDVDGNPCRVLLPFFQIPKRGGTRFIVEEAKKDGVYAKGLGILSNWSTLQ